MASLAPVRGRPIPDNAGRRPFARADAAVRRLALWPDLIFVAFALLVFVGLRPFAIRDEGSLLSGASGEGDIARQIAYVVVFAASLAAGLFYRGSAALKALPLSLLFVLAWCLLSVTWAIEPWIAFRRASLSVAVVLTIAANVDTLGPHRLLRSLRFVLAAILIVNLVSVGLVPHAVHLPGERAPDLIGAWRGLHFHKNIAGVTAAISALLFLWFATVTRRRLDWLLFAGALVFLVMTKAKTSIALLGVAIAAGYWYRRAIQHEGRGTLAIIAAVTTLLAALLGGLFYQSELRHLLDDPEFLTGRTAIWQALFASVEQHPLLGVGYGSFWSIGDGTPVAMYAQGWVAMSAHGHNGYLDILVQTGAIGLLLVVGLLILLPLKRLLCDPPNGMNLRVLCFSIIAFVVFFNVTESGLVERDRPEWVILVIALAVLNKLDSGGVPQTSQGTLKTRQTTGRAVISSRPLASRNR